MSYSIEDWRKRLNRPKVPVSLAALSCVLVAVAAVVSIVVSLRTPVRHEIVIDAGGAIEALADDLQTLAAAQEAQSKEDTRLQSEAEQSHAGPEHDRALDALIAIWDERDRRAKTDGDRAASEWFIKKVKGKPFRDLAKP